MLTVNSSTGVVTGVASGTATVTASVASSGNYCSGSVVSSTITVNIPAYTVTFNAGTGSCGTASLTEASGGAGVTLPTASPSVGCAAEHQLGYLWLGLLLHKPKLRRLQHYIRRVLLDNPSAT